MTANTLGNCLSAEAVLRSALDARAQTYTVPKRSEVWAAAAAKDAGSIVIVNSRVGREVRPSKEFRSKKHEKDCSTFR
jgi:hypothetical protein